MPLFRLCHHHTPEECGAVLASWRTCPSPLRGRPATASCTFGGHHVWWDVEAADREAALSLLPGFVAHRTEVVRVGELDIP